MKRAVRISVSSRLRLPLYEPLLILDGSWMISDKSRHLFPDWFGGSHLACQSQVHSKATLRNGGEREGGQGRVFLGRVKSRPFLPSLRLLNLTDTFDGFQNKTLTQVSI